MNVRVPSIIVTDEKPVMVMERGARSASRSVMHAVGWRAFRHG